MMKKVMLFILVALFVFVASITCISGCSATSSETNNKPRFIRYSNNPNTDEIIYVDTETGVMYVYISYMGGYTWGSVILDRDGKPMIAEEYINID